jgi:hypothetical protein
MDRFASSMLKVNFEGPDVNEQSLFQTFRASCFYFVLLSPLIVLQPFGRIRDIATPSPVPPGVLRSSVINYERLKSAVIARNVLYGLEDGFDIHSTSKTCLRPEYQKPMQANVVKNWVSNHPRISIPLIVFLLGTITYAVCSEFVHRRLF